MRTLAPARRSAAVRVGAAAMLHTLVVVACGAGPSGAPAAAPGRTEPDVPGPLPTAPPSSPVTAATGTVLPSRGDPGVVVTPTGVVAPVVGRDGDAWLVRTPCGNTARLRRATPVGPVTVVVDPGHGGDERGTVGPNGLAEATLNLAVARHVAQALAAQGFATLLTRTTDVRVTLATRAEIALRSGARVFVSVHHNADPDGPSTRPGTETYYQVASGASKRLAGLVYEEVVGALARYPVAWVADTDAGAKYRVNDRGSDYYGILRLTAGVPAVLAELAYLSNPPEAALLARPEVQRVTGEAVARGVVRFLTTADPGSGFTEPYPRHQPAGPGGGSRGCADPPLG